MSADPRTNSKRATPMCEYLRRRRNENQPGSAGSGSGLAGFGYSGRRRELILQTKENRMVNLAQVIKDLRVERSRAQKEVDRLEKAIGALMKLAGNPGRHAQENEKGQRRRLTAAARKRISRAQKARWAKIRRQKAAKA